MKSLQQREDPIEQRGNSIPPENRNLESSEQSKVSYADC